MSQLNEPYPMDNGQEETTQFGQSARPVYSAPELVEYGVFGDTPSRLHTPSWACTGMCGGGGGGS